MRIGEPDFHDAIRTRWKALGPEDEFEVTVLRGGNVIRLSRLMSVLSGG